MTTPRTILSPEKSELLENIMRDSSATAEAIIEDWYHTHTPIFTPENYEAQMELLDDYSDIQLWTVVYRNLEPHYLKRNDYLVDKHESGHTLSDEEEAEWTHIAELFNIYVLLRSKALLLLKERGYDVSHFFKSHKRQG